MLSLRGKCTRHTAQRTMSSPALLPDGSEEPARDCGAFALAPDAVYDEIHDNTQGKQKEKFGHGTITEKDYRRGIEKMQWDSGGKS